jgi:hypothetical protein
MLKADAEGVLSVCEFVPDGPRQVLAKQGAALVRLKRGEGDQVVD